MATALVPAATASARDLGPDPVPGPVRCVVNHLVFYSYDLLDEREPGELYISCI